VVEARGCPPNLVPPGTRFEEFSVLAPCDRGPDGKLHPACQRQRELSVSPPFGANGRGSARAQAFAGTGYAHLLAVFRDGAARHL